MKARLLPISFMIFLGQACLEKDFEYEIKDFSSEIVVNGEISVQDGVTVKVSRSVSPTTRGLPVEDLYLQDAQVQLFEDGNFKLSLEFIADNLYKSPSDFIPQVAKAYAIRVLHDQYEEVRSTDVYIPDAPIITAQSFKENTELSINGLSTYTLHLTLQDKADTDEYYELVIRSTFPQVDTSANVEKVIENENVNNICDLFYRLGKSIFFNDICFEGESVNLPIWIQPRPLYLPDRETYLPEKLEIRLYTVCRDTYLHNQSLNIPEEFALAFADPIPLHSNMSMGNGVFSALNYVQFEFDLK